ncbi:iron ABC transporter permease [Salinisphaera sp. Q1T1-3]|nr:iron ABC transporter permease [Salinisphaera sp. Q1T1-3]
MPLCLATGPGGLSPRTALAALFGSGDGGRVFLVRGLRLPRVCDALVIGAALGAAGCLIQTVARNRLATPAILGINEGATLAVMVWVFCVPGSGLGPWWIAPIGALAAAIVLVGLSGGIGMRGFRVLMIGIALSILLRSIVDMGMSVLAVNHATAVYNWSLGSLLGADFSRLRIAVIPVTLALAVAVALGRRLVLLGFDLTTARALGADVQRDQWLALTVAALLSGLAVGIAGPVGGPVGFVALASPVAASHLVGPGRVPVLVAALIGALIVLVADTLARVIAAPNEIAAGALTSVFGGLFVLWLLYRRTGEIG